VERSGTDPLFFFDENDVTRLTGLSKGQLRRWHHSGLFSPYNKRADSLARIALYDFRDLVSLRVIANLRKRYSVAYLRKVNDFLKQKVSNAPWRDLILKADGGEPIVEEADGTLTSIDPLGQTVHREVIGVIQIAEDTIAEIDKFRKRHPEDEGKIGRSRNIQSNKPVVKGTRITVAAIWAFYKAGRSTDEIIKSFPSLTPKDVEEAIRYAQQAA
jgi:uncharacterized protein (DUF433 family)